MCKFQSAFVLSSILLKRTANPYIILSLSYKRTKRTTYLICVQKNKFCVFKFNIRMNNLPIIKLIGKNIICY